jgi:hypothetical protein
MGMASSEHTFLIWQDESTGTFVVVPRSHKKHDALTRRVYRARPYTQA